MHPDIQAIFDRLTGDEADLAAVAEYVSVMEQAIYRLCTGPEADNELAWAVEQARAKRSEAPAGQTPPAALAGSSTAALRRVADMAITLMDATQRLAHGLAFDDEWQDLHDALEAAGLID